MNRPNGRTKRSVTRVQKDVKEDDVSREEAEKEEEEKESEKNDIQLKKGTKKRMTNEMTSREK